MKSNFKINGVYVDAKNLISILSEAIRLGQCIWLEEKAEDIPGCAVADRLHALSGYDMDNHVDGFMAAYRFGTKETVLVPIGLANDNRKVLPFNLIIDRKPLQTLIDESKWTSVSTWLEESLHIYL